MRALDELGGDVANRSRLIEQAVVEFLERRRRRRREARDRDILDAVADDLNREVADVLGYQANR
jgi:metal-responsive CopG/Arc/MetJ family transcriptional regulator